MEGDEFVNENFIRGSPELRKNIIKKKVSVLIMSLNLLIIYIGVRAGGRGGLQPPQSLGNSDFLGSKRKFGQSQFLQTFPCFIIIIILKR